MTPRIDFLELVRRSAEANGGRPLGESQFYRQTGMTRKQLWEAGFDSYGAACEAVGFSRNALTPRLSDDDLLRPLEILARQRGRFPPKGAFEVARIKDPTFPSWEAFKRRERQGPEASLRDALVAWCSHVDEFVDVATMLRPASGETEQPPRQPRAQQRVMGYVYLMRYGSGGKVFKIGRSENVPRRHAQLNTMTPQDMRVVHTIPTDDPEGIETYWKRRFDPKRVIGKNELFRLDPEDVAAFRARKYQ